MINIVKGGASLLRAGALRLQKKGRRFAVTHFVSIWDRRCYFVISGCSAGMAPSLIFTAAAMMCTSKSASPKNGPFASGPSPPKSSDASSSVSSAMM